MKNSHNFLKYNQFISIFDSESNDVMYASYDPIFCGGAYGHLQHPFDDMNLSFLDLFELLSLTVNGGFTPDNFVQTKCIEGDSIVMLKENGLTTIKEVVDNKILDKILSFNELSDTVEYADILNWSNNDNSEDWLEIETEDGNVIRVTPNHRVYVKGLGDIVAKNLKEGMELIIKK
jgi:hypothetical protein